MTDFDPFAEEQEPEPQAQDGEISEADQRALSEAAVLDTEVLPPLTGEEPLAQVIDAYARKQQPKTLPPLYGKALVQAVKDAVARNEGSGYTFALELQNAWGTEVFKTSAFYQAWVGEWEHWQIQARWREEHKPKKQ